MAKIVIDARFYGEAGPGRYCKNIVKYLEKVDIRNNYVVFLRKKGYELYEPNNKNFKKVLADIPWYSWWEQIFFLIDVLAEWPALLYVPHFNIPVLYPGRLVTAIPDIIMHEYSTEQGTTLPKPYFKFKKFVYRIVVWWAVVRSSKVIVPSTTVRDEFKKTFPKISENKYIVAPEGLDLDCVGVRSDTTDVLSEFGVTQPFLLCVGSMYEHKNIYRLIDAFQIMQREKNFNGQLVLIGKRDKFSEKVYSLVQELKLANKIIMPGMLRHINDVEIAVFRKHAKAFVFPSLKEGFSLTPLEAQAFDLPCAISDIPVHKEVYGESVLYFDPLDPKDIAHTVDVLITNEDLRRQLVLLGQNNLRKYDWIFTADKTLEVFKQVLKQSV